MRVGALALPVVFVLTFAVPTGLAPAASGAWVFVAFLATATAFSLFQVPYIALPAELTDDYDARTRLLTWRVVVLSARDPAVRRGRAAAAACRRRRRGARLPRHGGRGGPRRSVPGMFVRDVHGAARGRRRASALARSIRAGYAEGIAALRRSRPFRDLLAAFVLQGLATGVMLAGAQLRRVVGARRRRTR